MAFTSKFGAEEGSHSGEWECPDLIELTVDGIPKHKKWVLIVSIGDAAEFVEGSRTQYFIGEFMGMNLLMIWLRTRFSG
jgi:fructan beta-fructosidase